MAKLLAVGAPSELSGRDQRRGKYSTANLHRGRLAACRFLPRL